MLISKHTSLEELLHKHSSSWQEQFYWPLWSWEIAHFPVQVESIEHIIQSSKATLSSKGLGSYCFPIFFYDTVRGKCLKSNSAWVQQCYKAAKFSSANRSFPQHQPQTLSSKQVKRINSLPFTNMQLVKVFALVAAFAGFTFAKPVEADGPSKLSPYIHVEENGHLT
jgi:hypothetical protein